MKTLSPQRFIVLGLWLASLLWWSQAWAIKLSAEHEALFRAHAIPPYDWTWLAAQAYQESRFKNEAVSPVGARCLMQLMPRTALEVSRQLGVPPALLNERVCVMFGAFYMRRMLAFWTSERSDFERLQLALASYNAGAGNIHRAQKLAGGHLLWCGIAPHLHRVTGHHSAETRNYVEKIPIWRRKIELHHGLVVKFDEG